MLRVFYAELICSHEKCTDRFEAFGALEDLEALACDCGCALVVISLSEAAGERLELIRCS